MYGRLVIDKAVVFDLRISKREIQYTFLVTYEEVVFDNGRAFGLVAINPYFILDKGVLADTVRIVLQQYDCLFVFLKLVS